MHTTTGPLRSNTICFSQLDSDLKRVAVLLFVDTSKFHHLRGVGNASWASLRFPTCCRLQAARAEASASISGAKMVVQ